MKARLALYRDGRLADAFPIPGTRATIGRQEDNAIRLDDLMVSRHHAVVQAKGDAWEILDLDSTNGLSVNGIWAKQAFLKHRDSISIGASELVFELEAADSERASSQSLDLSPIAGSKTLSRKKEGTGAPPSPGPGR